MDNLNQITILPNTQATLAFLIQDGRILLAMKKRGFGAGKWNGIGGKQDSGESIDQTMAREMQEEIGVTPTNFERKAILDFEFLSESEWSQQVHVYIVTDWEGEPQEADEMAPQWYAIESIPFTQMWSDDPIWLPLVLSGKKLHGSFSFDDKSQVVSNSITLID